MRIDVMSDEGEQELHSTEGASMHISLPGEGGVTYCRNCGEQIEEGNQGWVHCGSEAVMCYDVEGTAAEPEQNHWANSARVDIQEDRIDVSISVGDPCGAFVMRVERVDDGTLRLSVPHPEDSLLPRPLRQTESPGYYEVG